MQSREDLKSLTVKELHEIAGYAAERLHASSHLYRCTGDADNSTCGTALVQLKRDTTISEAELLAELSATNR